MKKYSVGVDLGGTKILAGIVNTETGEIISSSKKRTRKKSSKTIENGIIQAVEEAICKANIAISELSSIGVGSAGQIDRSNGVLLAAPNLNAYNINFRQLLEDRFKIPAFVGNDVEVATIGEVIYGNGAGCKNLVCIFVGTGIGAGILCNGEIYRGATGTAGEIGHMIVSTGGRLCACGENGCLEAYASRTAIEKRIKGIIQKGHYSVITDLLNERKIIKSRYIQKAIEVNDEVVYNVITEAAEYLSSGIATVINFYNPELIILGGGLIEAVDFFYDLTVKKTRTKSLAFPSGGTKITRTGLKDYSALIGAALLEKYYSKVKVG